MAYDEDDDESFMLAGGDDDLFSIESKVPNCVVCIDTLGSQGGPASLPCGHNGCRDCLEKALKSSPFCPLCRMEIDPSMTLKPNLELKAALEQQARAAREEAMSKYQDRPPLPRYEGKDHGDGRVYGIATREAVPEINFKNVATGLVKFLAKKVVAPRRNHGNATQTSKADIDAYDQPWASVTLPTAPLLSGASEDVQAMQALLEAEPPEWLADSSTGICMNCSAPFQPITCGRHHCRFCGGIFCRACSSGRCLMPVKFRERNPQRVCDACYERLESVQRVICERVSAASQRATHDVTDATCMRSWLNTPFGLTMEQEIYKATCTIRNYAKVGSLSSEKGIPEAILKDAHGVAIVTVVKAGVVVTYKLGTGLVVARLPDGTWSAPSAITTFGLGWGVQAGGEITDFLIVLRSPEAVKAFAGRAHFSCGAGLSVAAGPVGRLAEAELRTCLQGSATCYSYSLSKGAFIGVSIEGGVVMRRGDTNACFYGDPYITSQDILSGVWPAPRAGAPLYSALRQLFSNNSAAIQPGM